MLRHFSEEELRAALEATAPPPPRHVLGLEGGYVPFHLGQNKTWDSQRRITAMCAGTQSGKCLAPDSLVPLVDGRRVRVDRVEAGDIVFSLGSDLKVRPATVTASFGVGVQHLYKIITASGRSISVTREHPLLSPDGWRESQGFSVGDFIGVPRILPVRGDGVGNPQMLRLLGYLIGDGGLTSSIRFTNKSQALVDDFASCLPPGFRIERALGSEIDYNVLGHRRNGRGHLVSDLRDWLREMGLFGKPSREKFIPDFVFSLPNTLVAHLLNALFASDGWVDQKGFGYGSASEQLVDDVMHLLLRFGVFARKREKQVKCNGRLFAFWGIAVSDVDGLAAIAGQIGILTKQEKLETLVERKRSLRPNTKDLAPDFPRGKCWEVLGEPGHSRWEGGYADQEGYGHLRTCRRRNVSRHFAQKLAGHFDVGVEQAYSDIYWDQIKEIVPLGDGPTWDLSVEGTANFIAEDIFAHNTVFGPWWLKRKIEQLGGGDYYAVTATFDLFNLKMLPELQRVFEERLGIGRYWGGSTRVIELADPETGQFQADRSTDPMWGRIILRSAESKGGLESGTAKAAWLDEAGQDRFRLQAWNAIRRRLAIHRGDILITTTLFNLGWLKTTIIDPAKNGGDVELEVLDNGAEVEVTDNEEAGIRLIQFDSIANPVFSVQEYRDAERTMPGDDFFMFYRGRVARLRTMIYDCFVEAVNKVDSFPIPARWPKAVGVDPLGAETAAIWIALDPDKAQVHVYREYLAPFGETTRGHVENVLEMSKNEIIGIWAGGGPSERQSRADWTGAGIRLFDPPNIGVWPAILRVYELMKPGRLVIHKSCVHLLDEIGSYQRDRDKDGSLTDRIKDKSKYHLLDALRYIVSLVTEPMPDGEMRYMDIPRVNVGY